jgi:prepilin-type N-terminal cleavage/methylation domain-containing protein
MENQDLQTAHQIEATPIMLTTSPAGIKSPLKGFSTAFSLVELLVVVAIMGTLAGVAAVSLRGLRSPALAGAANEFASALKSTRQMAIASGRKHVLIIPIANNSLTTNIFRSYAIFEELPPGDSANEPPFGTNTTPNPVYLAKTDWRALPDGAIFCNIATANYNTINPDPFQGATLGALFRPQAQKGTPNSEWKFFESFTNFPIYRPDNLTTPIATLNNTPFVGFYPGGRAFYGDPGNRQGLGVRLVQGFVQSDQIAITDTNNFYYVETDSFVGRVRVRNRESYR